LMLSLAPWSMRNYRAFGGLSPLPHNSGIVLDQIYNGDNPQSAIWIPPFVNYSNPSEIWRGFSAEADRRAARELSPPEVDRYWRDQALLFMRENPSQTLGQIARKSSIFLASTEVPNNRSAAEERLFSPVLELLPAPAVWLLAMGLAGTVWFAIQDRRWPIVAAPILVAWATVALFWAEDRFRFHAEPVLALCSGIWIDEIVRNGRVLVRSRWPMLAAAAVIAVLSLYLGTLFPAPPVCWDHVVWGYLKMGRVADARGIAERVSGEQPDNAPIIEALGFIAASGQQYREAVNDFQRAIELRPRSYVAHFNLAKAYLALGDRPRAAAEARTALELSPSSDTQALLTEIAAAP
jgi:tetratricopeptide (TPR) repeat protein